MHGQLVALLRPDVAYLGHVHLLHLEPFLSIVSSAESHNCHHEEENVTAHRKHGTRAVRRIGDHVHQSTDAREQLSSRGVLHQRATFGSPLVPPSQSDGAVVRTETRPTGPEEDGEPHAATLRRLIGLTEYVGLYLGKVLFSLCYLSVPLAISRSALLARLSSSAPPRTPVSSQLPAPHLRLLHGSIPKSRVLLRSDSLPAFSLAATLHSPVLSSLTYRYLHPSSAYHDVCGLLRSHCTFLTRPSGRVFPFIPLTPSSAPPRIAASLPFFFLFSPFPRSFPRSFFRGYRYKEHESTYALILTRLRRCTARMQVQ